MPGKQAPIQKPSSEVVLKRCLDLVRLIERHGNSAEGLTRKQIYALSVAANHGISERTVERYVAALTCQNWLEPVFLDDDDSEFTTYRYGMMPNMRQIVERMLAQRAA